MKTSLAEDQSPVGKTVSLLACKTARLVAPPYIFITHNESLPVCSLSA